MSPDDPDVMRALRLAWGRSYYVGGQDWGVGNKSKKSAPDFDTFIMALRDELRRANFIQEVKQKR